MITPLVSRTSCFFVMRVMSLGLYEGPWFLSPTQDLPLKHLVTYEDGGSRSSKLSLNKSNLISTQHNRNYNYVCIMRVFFSPRYLPKCVWLFAALIR